METVKVPEPFVLVPFFSEDEELPVDLKFSLAEALKRDPMLFDIYAYLDMNSCLKPWEDRNKHLPILLEHWKKTEPSITKFFQDRDRIGAMKPMVKMTKLFLAFLFWTNNHPVPNLKNVVTSIHELNIKPVNVEERISYILSTPNHHHAFTQLKELFIELQKKYAVSKLKK